MPVAIMWFRRDLRIEDNAALYHALKSGWQVVPVFIFDTNILGQLPDKKDRRVEFIYNALIEVQEKLKILNSTLDVYFGEPVAVFRQLMKSYSIHQVFANHDCETYALRRDAEIARLLEESGIGFHQFKDHVIFEKEEVIKDDGKPYTVFTPYSRKWKATLQPFYLKAYPSEKYMDQFFRQDEKKFPSLVSMGFQAVGIPFPGKSMQIELVRKYNEHRDFPAIAGTSKLGVHLRFGTISIRQLAIKAKELNETFLNELIWRDFYQMILWHNPHIGQGKAFKTEYDAISWRNDENEFAAWCAGNTGYPIVDAGMRELNATGFMHNRARMIVASFLAKHLLIDWRWGEAYFAAKLLDYDFASNNGGWQWASGSGCDAAPYFRIFNPYLQAKRFDPNGEYIKKWVPEFEGIGYPPPIVDHEFARKRCLAVFASALKN